jgi:hypothetical protein
MRLFRSIPFGLLDAGSASLATFVTGVYAVGEFDPADLGVYALFFAIFLVAAIVPSSLVFLPAEVRLLDRPLKQRLDGFRLTLPAGLPVSAGASLLVLLAWIPAADASPSLVVPLAVTTVLVAMLSPIQDHVRRVMHMAGTSWLAAMTSVVQLVVTGAALFAGVAAGVDAAWIPFGALLVANLVSTTIGLILARRSADPTDGVPFTLRDLAASGRWLTGVGLLPLGAAFLAAAIVDLSAGSEFLGFAEASRIASRPFLVFVTGISAVLNPPSLLAGRRRDRGEGVRLARISRLTVIGSGVLLLAWTGFDWRGNPMAWLVPEAYSVEGLTAFTILTFVIWGMLFSDESQLIGGGRELDIFKIYFIGTLVQIPIALTAPVTESYALILSIFGFGVVRWIGYRRAVSRLYPPDGAKTSQVARA